MLIALEKMADMNSMYFSHLQLDFFLSSDNTVTCFIYYSIARIHQKRTVIRDPNFVIRNWQPMKFMKEWQFSMAKESSWMGRKIPRRADKCTDDGILGRHRL
jgi:hypothetical protein